MPDALHAKLKDFAGYVIKALEQYQAGEYADALGNMRKAAEATCKALLIHALNEKRAAALITNASLQDLIGSVQRLADPPSEVVNHLKALQIQGNKGVHDAPVMRGFAAIGAVHLTALAQWLYAERLRIAIPAALAAALAGRPAKETLDAERQKLEEDQRALADRMAALQHQLNDLAEAEVRKHSEREGLEQEIAALRDQASERAALREEFGALREVVEEQRTNAAKLRMAEAPVLRPMDPPRSNLRWWIVGATALVLVALLAALWLRGDGSPATIATTQWAPPPDSVLRVVLVPFIVLQDDPQLELRFEEVLRAELERHASALHIAVELRTLDAAPAHALSDGEALALLDSLHAGLLFLGELTEPTSMDSGTVTLRYVMMRQQDKEMERFQPITFRTLREKATEVLVATTGNLMDRAMANVYARHGRWSQALALLYASPATTERSDWNMTLFRVQCHMELQQYDEALRETDRLHGMTPEHDYPYVLAAKAMQAKGRYSEAVHMYEQAVKKRPNDPELLLDFADILVAVAGDDVHLQARSKALVERSLVLDSTLARGWFYQAQSDYMAKRWSAAKAHFERAIALGFPLYPAKVNLAEILLFKVDKPDALQAERLLLEVFAADTTEPKALFLLGELYAKSDRRDPDKAKLFYERAGRRTPLAERESALGVATIALQSGRPKEAVALLTPFWAADNSYRALGNALAQALLETGQHREALAVGATLLRQDPLNKLAHYNMAYIHRFGNPDVRDLSLAVTHFREALRSDPMDTLVLNYLGNTLVDLHDPVSAEPFLRRGLALAPLSYGLNRGMALVVDEMGSAMDALPYYERAVQARSDDDLMLSNLAFLCLAEGPHKDIGKALVLAERSVQLQPRAPNRVVLAMALVSHKRYAQAAQQYQLAVAESPEVANPPLEEELRRRGY